MELKEFKDLKRGDIILFNEISLTEFYYYLIIDKVCEGDYIFYVTMCLKNCKIDTASRASCWDKFKGTNK